MAIQDVKELLVFQGQHLSDRGDGGVENGRRLPKLPSG